MQRYFSKLAGLLFLFSFSFQLSFAQEKPKIQLLAHFDSVRAVAPREKLYVHLDKSVYTTLDTIWFKAYLMDASINSYSKTSGLVYAEMVDEKGTIVQSMALPNAFGITWGSLALNPNKYRSGTYTFRSYTNWMQNFGDTYFFKKELKIINLETETPSNSTSKSTIATNQKVVTNKTTIKSAYDIQFLPEGGNWVAGRVQKIAFKALNTAGKGISISGEILDSKQNQLIKFKSNAKGMGFFNLMGSTDEVYTAKIQIDGQTINKILPKPLLSSTTLSVENSPQSDSLTISMFSNLPDQELTIVGQSRGVMCLITKLNATTKRRSFKVAKSIFPTGVCQVILMNSNNQMLNERNFFVNHHDELQLNVNSNAQNYGLRDSIAINLKVADILKNPVAGSFSVAVTADDQVLKDSVNDNTILSYFLLTSDLKGEIEEPGSYFHGSDIQKQEDLDALMLTQGWISYNWDLAKKPNFKVEKDYTINGRVTNLLNKPVAKAKMILFGKNKGMLLMDTVTNANGEFVFDRFPALDSASFVIQAKNAKGRTGTSGIVIDEFRSPPFSISQKNKQLVDEPIDSITTQLVATKKQEYELAIRSGVLLREVKITGKKGVRGSKNLNGVGEADQVLTEEDLEKAPKKTLQQLLEETVKGFRVGNVRKSFTRDFFVNSAVVRLVIDGIEVEFFYDPEIEGSPDPHYHFLKQYLDYYTAEDIKGIEIMANPRYSNRYKFEFEDPMSEVEFAFIEITTKTGQGPFLRKAANMYLLKPQTFGSTKVFYSPKYTATTKTDKRPDFRSTLFWNPNLLTTTNGEANFSFFSADKKGTYTVWIEGTDLQGSFGMKTLKLTIR